MNLRYDVIANQEVCEQIKENLKAYNNSFLGETKKLEFGFAVYDEDNRLLGGLTGDISGVSMTVNILWVSQELRGQGVGKKLLQQAEDFAKEKQCKNIMLYTVSFQAPAFYEKCGFELIAKINDFVTEGNAKYEYIKYL